MELGETIAAIYAVMALLTLAFVFVSAYLAAIEEKGLVIGGTFGIIPASIIGVLCGLFWPIALFMMFRQD